ncbi:hypothetical protein FOA52_000249 [Chlamydomonas sp. UWO 241]|nr:hypothetical protein FOA52_000249 [Chlamydomonas sp. UWO 241]
MQELEPKTDTTKRNLDSLLDYVPDALLDKAIEAKKKATQKAGGNQGSGSSAIVFDDLMDLLRIGDFTASTELLFDSYAMRMLVNGSPECGRTTQLSSLMATPDRAVHRLRVECGGEAAVLTFTMQLQEGLVGQYRSAPQISQCWRLKSIVGEPDNSEFAAAPGLDVGPEAVVAGQLDALRQRDVARVFAFASPDNRAATGPVERFGEMLESPMYKALLGHSNAETLRRIQLTPDTYAEVVGVVSDNTGVGRPASFVYVWSVGKVQGEAQGGLWMTNNVQLVSAQGGASPWAPGGGPAP